MAGHGAAPSREAATLAIAAPRCRAPSCPGGRQPMPRRELLPRGRSGGRPTGETHCG
jgi:hypothetical protein